MSHMPAAFSFASRAAASGAPEVYRCPEIEVPYYKQKHNRSCQYSRVALTRCCMIVCSSSVRLLDSSCLKRSLVLLAQTHIMPCCAPHANKCTAGNNQRSVLVRPDGLVAFSEHPCQPRLLTRLSVFFTALHDVDRGRATASVQA